MTDKPVTTYDTEQKPISGNHVSIQEKGDTQETCIVDLPQTTPDFDAHIQQEVQTLYEELEHKFEPSNLPLYEIVREYLYKDWRKKHGI